MDNLTNLKNMKSCKLLAGDLPVLTKEIEANIKNKEEFINFLISKGIKSFYITTNIENTTLECIIKKFRIGALTEIQIKINNSMKSIEARRVFIKFSVNFIKK